ncbi:hypothetical protein [Devosia sp.]|uniref:hypothetical protein n=1 Tax=Devosia sp. TaxID=1871048 RepID=UPI002734A84E|nr:hypothetical protein [Devosia sp.]MDP2782152.1 hypothetical protein [Devosia sp.]
MTVQQNESSVPASLRPSHSSMLMWAPCIAILLYLISSLMLFKFGPIDWAVHNEGEFWAFNALYLSMFSVGYAVAHWRRHWWTAGGFAQSPRNFTERFFWPVWFCAVVVVLIAHRNLTLGPSYIPTTLLSDFITGLITPEKGYIYKLSAEANANFSGNPPVTALYGALSFSKLVLVYMLVSDWSGLSRLKKILGLAVAIFPILSGVSVGTNKPIFDVAFTFLFLILACVVITPHVARLAFIKSRLVLIGITVLIVLFSVAYFQHTMSVRAGGLEYADRLGLSVGAEVASAEEARPVAVKPAFKKYCDISGGVVLKGCELLSIGTIYLTQGYYGMSLSADIPFETTYGLGHSKFIIDALRNYLDVDLGPRTFQQKIDDRWSAEAQWHSAYSQWANDVGFLGVALVMFAVGFYVCAIWTSALTTHNMAAVCNIPVLAILIFFIPANNQVFNQLESLATFIVLLITWLGSLPMGTRVRTFLRAK